MEQALMDTIADGSPRQLARIAGGLYLINILGGAYAITVVPAMLVVGHLSTRSPSSCFGGRTRPRGVEIVDGATVSVAVVGSRTEADLIAGMLRSHGVSATVSADDAGGQYRQMQREGVRVLVAPSDEASARRLLAATDDTGGSGQ
jgi:hypothetical protein